MTEQEHQAQKPAQRSTSSRSQFTPTPKQTNQVLTEPNRPTTDDRNTWHVYWKQQGQPWRMEPEIDELRQKELSQHRAIIPDVAQGIYPFKGVKLCRADVEWLLATLKDGCEPVDPDDKKLWIRERLDVRGADLRMADLHGLPLQRLCGGIERDKSDETGEGQYVTATTLMEGADLSYARLEGADLSYARLEGANLSHAHLNSSSLKGAQLKGANLSVALLNWANLSYAHLEGADLSYVHLIGTHLYRAQLQGADIPAAWLRGTELIEALLEGTNLYGTSLEEVNLSGAKLGGADLRDAKLGNKERIGPQLADVHWGDTNLAVVDWSLVKMLGDEHRAKQEERDKDLLLLDETIPLYAYRAAVRANRQLAVALQAQGLNEEAVYFAYRAHLLQRKVLWYQVLLGKVPEKKKFPTFEKFPWYVSLRFWLVDSWWRIRRFMSYIFSWFLDLLAGYGYHPVRTLGWYLLVVLSYTTVYFQLEHLKKLHLSFVGALIFSITAFHGRGFFPGGFGYDDPVTILAASEAVIGLLIELSFIATFTQRFFGK